MPATASVKADSEQPANDAKSFLKPAEMTAERASGQIPFDSISRSYFLMRLLVGVLGLMLPVVLLLGDLFFLGANFSVRGSLSAYYHSGMRDIFVSILAVVGILLITYKITEHNRDNILSIAAGISAMGVALFPTGIPDGVEVALTPLQDRLGEGVAEFIHFSFAAVFILCLGLLCFDFARRERQRTQKRAGHDAHQSPEFWYSFHLSMAGLIGLAAAFIVLTQAIGVFDRHSILIGEIVVTVAFGLSWLFKGLDRDVLPRMITW
jgi:hypothetical protein